MMALPMAPAMHEMATASLLHSSTAAALPATSHLVFLAVDTLSADSSPPSMLPLEQARSWVVALPLFQMPLPLPNAATPRPPPPRARSSTAQTPGLPSPCCPAPSRRRQIWNPDAGLWSARERRTRRITWQGPVGSTSEAWQPRSRPCLPPMFFLVPHLNAANMKGGGSAPSL